MSRSSSVLSLAAALAGCLPIGGQPLAAAAPAESFGSIPAQAELAMSPNGHWLAWLDHSSDRPKVVMFDLVARKSQRSFGVPANNTLRSLEWADNETLLITVSGTKEAKLPFQRTAEYYRTFAEDNTGGDPRTLLMDGFRQNITSAILVAARSAKPKTVYLWTLDFSATAGHQAIGTRLAGHRSDSYIIRTLFEVDTRTGKGTILDRGTQFTEDWAVDGKGNVVAREEWDGARHIYRLLAKDGSAWKTMFHAEDGSRLNLAGTLADQPAVVALGAIGGSHQSIWAIPLDGSSPKLLIDDADVEIAGVVKDPNTGSVVGVELGGNQPAIRWFDATIKQRAEAVQRAFAGRGVRLTGWSSDGQQVLASVSAPNRPATYYIVDFVTHKAEIAGEEYPALADAQLGQVQALTYKARDGTEIPAYLTRPPGAASTAVPLVVLPHGGPRNRDSGGFDWLAQFLATRGYAVLQPQFRGSTGFGEAFRRAGDRQWGGLMQDDVTDGVRSMIDRGIVDPQRVCIVGASYGGYVALAGVAFTPELYRCAASVAGVSDLPALLGEIRDWPGSGESDIVGDTRDSIGVPTDPKLAAVSPIHSVATIRVPILLLHGTGDSVVPFSQSEQMWKALQAAGKSVQFVRLDSEDHWLSRTETRVRVLKELETFLAANLGTVH
jgi:dipeptidyl aminopeptidase/acylaminoacyl peptidase